MAGRCFSLIADAMLISVLEFVGVSWQAFLPGSSGRLKVWSLIDVFGVMAVRRYPYCALETPP